MELLKGTVIWFANSKGYGFIKRDDGKADIFVHYSGIIMPGFKTLSTDNIVVFEEDYSFNNKVKAINVVVIKPE